MPVMKGFSTKNKEKVRELMEMISKDGKLPFKADSFKVEKNQELVDMNLEKGDSNDDNSIS